MLGFEVAAVEGSIPGRTGSIGSSPCHVRVLLEPTSDAGFATIRGALASSGALHLGGNRSRGTEPEAVGAAPAETVVRHRFEDVTWRFVVATVAVAASMR